MPDNPQQMPYANGTPSAPAQPQGPVRAVDATADLLGDLLAIEAPPGAVAVPLAQPSVMILALEAPPGPSIGNAGAAGDPLALALYEQASSVQPTGSVADWFRALTLKDSGVLYEDPHIQIGIKSEGRGPLGRIVFFVGNKNTGPVQGVRAAFLPPPHLRVQASKFPDAVLASYSTDY